METDDISRDLVLGQEFQRLVGVGLAETLCVIMKLGRHTEVLSEKFIESKQTKIDECRDGDISISGRIFRDPLDITDQNGLERRSNVVNTLRSCKDVLRRRNDVPEIFNYCRSFHSQVREIFYLVEYLKEVRNILSHDNRRRDEFGASVATVGCAIRLIELLPVPSDFLPTQKEFIKKATVKLKFSQNLVPQRSDSEQVNSAINTQFLIEARDLVAEMRLISSSIGASVRTHQDSALSENTDSLLTLQTEPYALDDELDDVESDFASLMTVPILRQRLEQINSEIREFLGDRWVGPGSSLLQGAIVDEVLLNEPTRLTDMLALPDVAWRYERYKDLVDLQLEQFGSQIEEALQSTAWSFEKMV